MKNKKSMDALMGNLKDQKDAIVLNPEGKSIQYFCGIGGYAKEFGNQGDPPTS